MTRREMNPSSTFVKKTVLMIKRPFTLSAHRIKSLIARRPHRSFRRTKRRDLPKSPPLPGYIFFTTEVFGVIKKYWKSYVLFLLVYTVLYLLLVGISDPTLYNQFAETFRKVGAETLGGDVDAFVQTTTLFFVAVSGSINPDLSEVQQLSLVLTGLYAWLAVVWFLRNRLVGNNVNVRDALYSCGAPMLSSYIVFGVGVLQLVPLALAMTVYGVAQSLDYISDGALAMLFGGAMILVAVLTLYWIVSTFFALIIVTLPGTYPFKALRMASDIVIGRRLSIVLRFAWMAFVVLMIWVFVLVPVILLSQYITLEWLQVIPWTIQLLGGMSILFVATYIYLLYRRMIDEPNTKKQSAKKIPRTRKTA